MEKLTQQEARRILREHQIELFDSPMSEVEVVTELIRTGAIPIAENVSIVPVEVSYNGGNE